MSTDPVSSGAFDQIASDERVSGFQAEVKGVAGVQTGLKTVCIVAQMLTTGAATPGQANDVPGDGSAAVALFGRGSHACRIVNAFRAGNTTTPITVIGLSDNPAGVAASRTLILSGTALSSGTLNVYIGLDRIQVGVGIGDTAATLAAELAAAINANLDLMVTASVPANAPTQVLITSKHKGEIGNDINLTINLQGSLGGESLPLGLLVGGLGSLSGGTANPDQTPARAAIQGHSYQYYLLGGWSDSATLNAWSAELESMWSPDRQLYGRLGFTARRGSLSQLKSFGNARNDRFISVAGTFGTPGPIYEMAARYAAQVTRSLINHPARPLHTLVLADEMAASPNQDFAPVDRKDLLWNGVATLKAGSGGTVQIDRAITLYQQSSNGDPDDTWLDVTTPATVGNIVESISSHVFNTFIATRCILVDDDTAVGAGIACASPKKIEASVFAHYETLVSLGLAENFEAFKKLFRVGRDPQNPTRVNMIYTPDLANPLITFAAQIAFSLQWPADLAMAA